MHDSLTPAALPQPSPAARTPPPVRRLLVELSAGFGRRWHGGDAFRTQFLNALSMSFPVGEQYFIDSVREALADLPHEPAYDALRADIRGFIGQEATHRKVHGAYNAVLESQGLVNHWQRWAGRRIAWGARFRPINKLAITCAYEHFTAVLADGTLRHPVWLDGAEATMQTVWRWHAAEETEHRAVAFDLYQALGGGSVRRRAWFVYVGLTFAMEAAVQTAINLWHDGALLQPRTWWNGLRFLAGRDGMLIRSAGPLLAYLRRDFHPDHAQEEPTARSLAQSWLAAHADRFRTVGATP